MQDLPPYRTRLILSVTFPLTVLFSIIFLANDFSLLLQTTGLFLLNFSYIIFEEREGFFKKGVGVFRIFTFLLIVIMFGLGFIFIFPNLNYFIFSNFKLGWIIGLILVAFLSFQILGDFSESWKRWGFIKNDNSLQHVKKITIIWGLGILMFLVIYLILVWFSFESLGWLILTGNIIGLLSFVFIIANHHLSGNINPLKAKNPREIKFWFGIFLISISFFVFLWPSANVIALILLVLGIRTVTKITTTEDAYKNYRKRVVIPSLLIIILSFFSSSGFFEMNAHLATGQNGRSAKELIFKRDLIQDQMSSLYKKMQRKGDLSEYIRPDFEINIIDKPSIWEAPELNLEIKYSYELLDPIYADSVQHFRPGRYALSKGNVAYAIAQSFRISINEYLKEYFQLDRAVELELTGSADKVPIVNELTYKGEYDEFFRLDGHVNIWQDGVIVPSLFKKGDPIVSNFQLAALRAVSVRDYINRKVTILEKISNPKYKYSAFVDTENEGGEFRKVAIILKIYNVIPLND